MYRDAIILPIPKSNQNLQRHSFSEISLLLWKFSSLSDALELLKSYIFQKHLPFKIPFHTAILNIQWLYDRCSKDGAKSCEYPFYQNVCLELEKKSSFHWNYIDTRNIAFLGRELKERGLKDWLKKLKWPINWIII